jgi:hypothetical protein
VAPIFPQLISAGGPTLAKPKIVPVFFPNYDFTTEVTDFVNKLGATDYWHQATSEYNVGPATGGTPIMLTEAAPTMIDDRAIQTWLIQKFTDGTLGTPDKSTIYAIYYPTGTTITQGGAASCQQFGAYHNEVDYNAQTFAYAVIPECSNFKTLKGIDMVTGASSHEFIEASTDPYVTSNPAYDREDGDHLAWMFFSIGGEDGDLCAQNPASFYKPDGFAYTVQRGWSNEAAQGLHDPCVPALASEPYFYSVPNLTDRLLLGMGVDKTPVMGAQVLRSVPKTISINLYADGTPSGPWEIEAIDSSEKAGGDKQLAFTFDKTSGVAGDQINMTITVVNRASDGVEAFLLTSTLGNQKSFWPGVVYTP